MPKDTKSQTRFLEMQYSERAGCHMVSLREEGPAILAQFPDDEAIRQLWREVTQEELVSLQRPPTQPLGKFFLLKRSIKKRPQNVDWFLYRLEKRCLFITRAFTQADLAMAQISLSQSPLFLVRYEREGQVIEEFVPAEQASWLLDPEFSRRELLDDVIELKGSSIQKRTITVEERKKIWNMTLANG